MKGAKIDCLSFVMCPLLAQLIIGFFSSFFAAAVYSTNEANKAGLKQSIFLDVCGCRLAGPKMTSHRPGVNKQYWHGPQPKKLTKLKS
jgi:hypothetical protein